MRLSALCKSDQYQCSVWRTAGLGRNGFNLVRRGDIGDGSALVFRLSQRHSGFGRFGELLAESSNWRAVSSNWWSRESRVLMMCNSMLVDGITMQATAMNLTFHPLDQTPN